APSLREARRRLRPLVWSLRSALSRLSLAFLASQRSPPLRPWPFPLGGSPTTETPSSCEASIQLVVCRERSLHFLAELIDTAPKFVRHHLPIDHPIGGAPRVLRGTPTLTYAFPTMPFWSRRAGHQTKPIHRFRENGRSIHALLASIPPVNRGRHHRDQVSARTSSQPQQPLDRFSAQLACGSQAIARRSFDQQPCPPPAAAYPRFSLSSLRLS